MKKLTFCLIVSSTFLSSCLFAQNWVNMMSNPNVNVQDVQAAFNQWYEQHKGQDNGNLKKGTGEAEDEGAELFRRWEYYMAPRTYPTGVRPNMDSVTNEYKQYLKTVNNSSSSQRTAAASNWQYVGNTSVPNGGGAGRVNRVRFYPGNTNIIFACSPSGGLWKTTNGGTSWSTNTDQLTEIGTSDIAINPLKPSIMYLGTGDNDGVGSGYTPSTVGILRSNDGGNTWNATGLSNTIQTSGPTGSTSNQVIFNPEDTGTIFAAMSSGLYYSKNGGTTWTQSINDNIKDVEFEPFHGSTVFAGSFGGNFYRSVDSGKTFTQITAGLPNSGVGRLAIGVTAADSNTVYVLAVNGSSSAYYGMYRSTDRGQTFSMMSQSPNLLGWSSTGSDNSGQAWYNLAILVSPTDRDSVFVAGSYLWLSTDGGATWTFNNNFANNPSTHVDIHCLLLYPGSSTNFLLASDGGVAVTPDAGNSWSDISNNLGIAEQYCVGASADNSSLWITGWQDNGTSISGSPWQAVWGGDGMTCFIDNTTDNTAYVSTEYGNFAVITSTNYYNATGGITEQGSWNTPWLQDPQQPNVLYSGFTNVWESQDQGNSWAPISSWGTGSINAIAVCATNDQYIYASEGSYIFMTSDGGTSWTNVTNGIPAHTVYISNIAVNTFDPLEAWVCFSGWNGSNKVFKTTNGGTSWTNVSSGLPNLPVNCIIYQPGSADGVYVGTDIGVYYMDNNTGGWIPYSTGLPNVEVFDLQLVKDNTLLAATFGRGSWETSTYANVNTSTNTIAFTGSVKVYPNPTSGNVQVAFDGEAGQYEINVTNILGQTVFTSNIHNSGHYSDNIDLSGVGAGVYIVAINGMNTKVEKKVVVY